MIVPINRRNCSTVSRATSAPASSPSCTLSINPPGTAPKNAVFRSSPPQRKIPKATAWASGTNTHSATSDGSQPNACAATSGVKAPPMATPITGTKHIRNGGGRVTGRPKIRLPEAASRPVTTKDPSR